MFKVKEEVQRLEKGENSPEIKFEDSKDKKDETVDEIPGTPLASSTHDFKLFRPRMEDYTRATPVIAGYLQLIPTFSGDQESDQHTLRDVTDRIASIAPSAAWTKEVCLLILKSRLKGHAAAFIESSNALRFSRDYDHVVQALEKQFRETENDYFKLSRLTSCKQLANESVKEYAIRFRTLSRGVLSVDEEGTQIAEMKDGMLRGCFINGLNVRLRRQVLSRVPKSFQQAIDISVQEESFENMTSKSSQVHLIGVEEEKTTSMTRMWKDMLEQKETILKKIQDLTNEIREESRNRFEKLEDRVEQLFREGGNYSSRTGGAQAIRNNGYGRNQIKCYSCGRMGHYRYECRGMRQPFDNPEWTNTSQAENGEQGTRNQTKASFLGGTGLGDRRERGGTRPKDSQIMGNSPPANRN